MPNRKMTPSVSFNILMLLLFSSLLWSQPTTPIGENDLTLQGYEEKLSGSDIQYHSPSPAINQALFVRATTGKHSMRWKTETVPANFDAPHVTFIWLAGMGSNLGDARMDLKVNDHVLPFWVNNTKNWDVKGPKGISLHYRHAMTDGARDHFGYLFLRLPRTEVQPGKPLAIEITGSRANQQTWCMTFKAGLEEGLSFKAYPALLKGPEKRQALAASVYHFRRPAQARLYAGDRLLKEAQLAFGHNILEFSWPEVQIEEEVELKLTVGEKTYQRSVLIEPVRRWQLNFVQHSHTDIGYTRPQTEILAEHLRYIDYALDYCDATDDYPSDAQFRWTCEAAWAVDEYLKSRPPAQIERLKRRIKEGRIEVTAMYFNFDELPDEQTLAASLAPLRRFDEHGIDVKLSMQNDVNGTGWCFNDFFNTAGIKYLDMGTHGHRALICFDVPTAFWWESPAGNRILAFRAEHYMTGNTVMGIHTEDFAFFEDKVLTYLNQLGERGYPHDLIAIQHSGYLTDNSPPSTLSSDMIRQWNEKYEWPKLRSAIAREFFEQMDKEKGNELPVYRVAWPDWWTDGFGSAAREVAATRDAHSHIIANQGLLSMAKMLGSQLPEGIQDRIAETNKAILFYGEHTLGSSESVRDPYGRATMEQREMKESFAWEANRRARMIGEEAMGLLQEHFPKADSPSLLVFNTLSWARNGMVEAYIDHQILPEDRQFRIVDETGAEAPAQKLGQRSDGSYWAIWVEDIPAFGAKRYFIDVGEEKKEGGPESDLQPRSIFENNWFRLQADLDRGVMTSLIDKELQQELLDPAAEWALGELIHEQLGDRTQMEAFTLNDYKRNRLDTIWYDGYQEGPVWNTIRFKGETRSFFSPNGFTLEYRLFNTTKRIDLVYEIVKKPIVEPEGIYLSFPFALEDGKIFSEVPGGIMEAGVDQLPGSANDWNTVQYFATVRNEDAQIVFSSQEAPLVQFGAINTGRYQTGAQPATNHIYSWPMNNYWTTNFNADQRGGHRWRYFLTSGDDVSNQFATRFGWGARIPLPVRVLPGGADNSAVAPTSLLTGFPDNILVITARPEEHPNSIRLQVRELAGRSTKLELQSHDRKLKIEKVDILGRPMDEASVVRAFESAFFRISW